MWQDLRVAGRSLWRSPAFTWTVMLTLALGIGVTSVVFSVVDAVLLRPLPFRDPGRLVIVWERRQMNPNAFADPKRLEGTRDWFLSNSELPRYQRENRTFAALAGYSSQPVSLTGLGEPERLKSGLATPELFDLLGVRPAAGRTFAPDEDRNGNNAFVVLSDSFWRRRFGGERSAIGSKLTLEGEDCTIIGVLPPGRIVLPGLDEQQDVWLPGSRQITGRRRFAIYNTVGRLRPGVTLERAAADLSAVATAGPPPHMGRTAGARVAPVIDELAGKTRPALLILLAAVGCVLLVGCVNIANLMLARNGARRSEFAMRVALGAGPGRLARHTLAECAWLAALGGAAGLAAGRLATRVLLLWVPPGTIPRLEEVGLDWRVVAFAAATSIAAALLFGLPAAAIAPRAALYETLKQAAPGGGGSRRGVWLRRAMVAAEIAIAVVLVIGAGLLTRSFLRLRGVDLGFHTEQVTTLTAMLPESRYSKPAQRAAFADQVLARLRASETVEAAAATNFVPVARGMTTSYGIEIEGRNEETSVFYRAVTPDFFRAMGIALRRGRTFTARDTDAAIVINDAMARRFWPDRDPLGARIKRREKWAEVVGVVADVKHDAPGSDTAAEMYAPYSENVFANVSFVVRTRGEAAALLRTAVKSVDAGFPIGEVKTMEQIVSDSIATPRFYMRLMALFAALAAALAAVGIYGVIAYSAVQRTREMGVRLAVGASRASVFALLLREGLSLGVAGAAIGVAAAAVATRLMKAFLFGVTATDATTFVVVPVLFVTVAAAASCVPAWRTGRIDPVVTLRAE